MSLQEEIDSDLKQAMKQGEKDRLRVLRSMKTEISRKRSEGDGEDINDEDVRDVINRMVKQRRESIEEYEEGGRDDLAGEERRELDVLKSYLPDEPDEEEIEHVIDDVIEEVGASDMRDMGDVMKTVMQRFADVPVDGSEINQKVRERLQ